MNNIQIRGLQMLILVIATALMLVACIGPVLTPGDAPPMDPLSVVDVVHQTINSDNADEAVVIDNGSVIDGKELIRAWALHSQRMAGTRRAF